MNPLDRLDQILIELGRIDEDVMMLDELDGFFAGILVAPEMIPPSIWAPHIWSRDGQGKLDHLFATLDETERVLKLIMDHYNMIANSLLPPFGMYEPVLSYDENNGDTLWELWSVGFARALDLTEANWLAIAQSGDQDAVKALGGLRMLIDIDQGTSNLAQAEKDRLTLEAPELIPDWIETLAVWRMTANPMRPPPKDVGRNDPCPCGSGRKYKQCHGAN
jgi:uncharacterized protein